jgi:hypothetical protein
MTADGGDEKSRFRWLDAVRYTVAAAVTVLIMAVIVNAIKVVLRPESLQLFVSRGSISAEQFKAAPPPEPKLVVGLNLRAQNPSGRVRMYYLGISAYLFENTSAAASSLDPGYDCIVTFPPNDIAVVQQEAVESMVTMKMDKGQMDPSYFDKLYNNGSRFSGMTLRLDGDLITELTSELNKTSRTTYYCEELFFGGSSDDEDLKNRQDVICKQRRG